MNENKQAAGAPSTRPAFNSGDLIVGVIGCGVMGRGIAQIAALAGTQVKLVDSRAGAAEAARQELIVTFSKLVEKGRLTQAAADAAEQCLHACNQLPDLADAHMIVEAIVEDLTAKKTLFHQLESIISPTTILATNTSSLSVTAIAAGLQFPQRVAGFHFFNPVPLMKIVEAIGGFLTDPTIVDYLIALGTHWGHATVRAKDTPGFIVNHAGRGYGTEGLRILAENTTDIPTLDQILRDCAGFKLGPCELMDLTGLDVSHPVMESIYQQYYEEPRFRPQGLTRQMLTAGVIGKKVGQGFYQYDNAGKKISVDSAKQSSLLPSSIWISPADKATSAEIRTLIIQLATQAGVAIELHDRPSTTALCIVTPLGEDASTCCADHALDASRTVAVESLFDFSKRRVVMTTPATTPSYRAMACGLLGADGAAVSVIRDSAGLVAQRVVAHIINIASDIAQQAIASPTDIDRAVKLGLGYPHGPLAWGDVIGAKTVLTILDNLLKQTGDPRYRASPWLKRRAHLGLSLHHEEA
ncbi:3-hydroxyacyl-CoA dehydrogenase [Undibacterium sp. RTI2.1]|uniref:3-hydroxyacyl-CoA dehydrogenase n=1 Tax=unclassified Undibacterium TaxID=2630295 RepID=UPI002AB5D9ED|nr:MULTISPECIES: 3-hydroxyacyl-CoA dehydrogenase [unclassified Undibacterium]MDY7540541.1 3-hydroxyacyl-CoA dehydrogenase [Undibacterium sp. 5I1]MEB0032943.1 3-hydroxyacyl-CoA dehydrogenase [Undibacterium sp. RTI2.1]MEB0116517.1 3-hydroxyacyl-CoA dehydrogenase [Undibacterium sp. RTI2.2]MEB0231203.1 3-hydroxyacyl-CoA dehydrogenase [Undibacterium sp. 10I3]MEB0256506.1 3-hydroxyacyl-CoA dehydrogenase [Undibacterium sp. 5I1]